MRVLDIFFPKRCVGCGKVGRYVCFSCAGTVTVIHPSETICPICQKPSILGTTHQRCRTRYTIDGLTSFFHYNGVVRKAVKALKYRLVSDLVEEFIDVIPQCVYDNRAIQQYNNATLIPIPLHPARLRQRGFNQAEVLGRFIAKRFNIPMRTDVLVRARHTVPQVDTKNRKARLANMDKVFIVPPDISVSLYPNIVLFDDVYTTGATLRSAASALKRAGARQVWGLTIAR